MKRGHGTRALLLVSGAVVCLLVAAAAWAAFAPLPRGPREVEYVIPKGTGDGTETHGNIGMLPARLQLTLGVRDIVIVKNDDAVEQRFGPVLLGPGQTYRLPFNAPGRYQFACSASQGEHIVVTVDRAPGPGWTRLRWRIARLLDR
jgi:hypothetical protein